MNTLPRLQTINGELKTTNLPFTSFKSSSFQVENVQATQVQTTNLSVSGSAFNFSDLDLNSNDETIATTRFVRSAIDGILGSNNLVSTLDTIYEIQQALGSDPNFSNSMLQRFQTNESNISNNTQQISNINNNIGTINNTLNQHSNSLSTINSNLSTVQNQINLNSSTIQASNGNVSGLTTQLNNLQSQLNNDVISLSSSILNNTQQTINLQNQLNNDFYNKTSTDNMLNLKADKTSLQTTNDNITIINNKITNIDNVRDIDKPISNLTQLALNLKVNTSDLTTNYNTKEDINLLLNSKASVLDLQTTNDNLTLLNTRTSNINNTRDVDKPISTQTQTALDLKANLSDLTALTSNLSSNYYDKVNTDQLLNDKASISYVDQVKSDIMGGIPTQTLDTITEIANQLTNNNDSIGTILTSLSNKADQSSLTSLSNNLTNNYFDKTTTTAMLNNKADIDTLLNLADNVLNNYFDKTTTNSLLNNKANVTTVNNLTNTLTNDYYDKVNTDQLLNDKASISYVDQVKSDIMGGIPTQTLDTITEIANQLTNNNDSIGTILNTLSTKADQSTVTTLSSNIISNYYNKNAIDASLQSYYTKSQIDSNLLNYYDKMSINSLLLNKADSSDLTTLSSNLNTNYYNKNAVDNALLSYYNKIETDNLLNAKASISYVDQVKSDIYGGIPTQTLDTITEIANQLTNNNDSIGTILTSLSNKAEQSSLTTLTNNLSNNYYSKSAIDASLQSYYTKSQIDSSLLLKADLTTVNTLSSNLSTNYYNRSSIDSSLQGFYTKSQIDVSLGQKQNSLTFDIIPTNLSSNPITSGGVFNALNSLTKSSVGLGNVDNTSDLNKPISTAVQTALNNKQNTLTLDSVPTSSSSNFVTSGSVFNALNSLTKSSVGLGNVDNTSDLSKPISTAVQTALNNKQNTITNDSIPTSGSNNYLTSGSIFTALAGKQNTLTLDSIPTSGSSNFLNSGAIFTAIQGGSGSSLLSSYNTWTSGNVFNANVNFNAGAMQWGVYNDMSFKTSEGILNAGTGTNLSLNFFDNTRGIIYYTPNANFTLTLTNYFANDTWRSNTLTFIYPAKFYCTQVRFNAGSFITPRNVGSSTISIDTAATHVMQTLTMIHTTDVNNPLQVLTSIVSIF